MANVKYRFIGQVADTIRKQDTTVPVAPGDFVELSDKDLDHEDNQHLVEGGLLIRAAGDDAGKEVKK